MPSTSPPKTDRVLVFHQTAPNLRHASIEYGIEAIEELGVEHGFAVEQTQDSGAFTDANLARFDAVVWLNTIGVVFDDDQKAALRRYVTGGGGWAGVHGPAGQENNWPWYYTELLGTYIRSLPRGPGFPETQSAMVEVVDHDHPSTAHLPDRWKFAEEWWNFYESPRQYVRVLARLDESTYDPGPGAMGGDHPIAWCHQVGAGRAWYTNLGHSIESYADPAFRAHLLGGIHYAMGRDTGSWAGPATDPDTRFARVDLAQGRDVLGDPTGLAVLADGRVLHAARGGDVWLSTPGAGTTLAGRIAVQTRNGDGLLGLAAHGGSVCLYYAPTSADYRVLDRFQLVDGTLRHECELLRVPARCGVPVPRGGHVGIDRDGNVLLSTGDDGSASAAADPADPRGKLLRVTEPGRFEVLATGLREPAGFGIDPATGDIYLGDHGADEPTATARFVRVGDSGHLTWLEYGHDTVPEFGARRAGLSPVGGAVCRAPSDGGFPARYAGSLFAAERERGWLKEIEIRADGSAGEIRPFVNSLAPVAPVDLTFGPDGALYVLDAGGPASPPALYLINYVGERATPVAVVTASTTAAAAPLDVELSPAGSHDPAGGALTYAWDLGEAGGRTTTGPEPVRYRLDRPGRHVATLTVRAESGATATASVEILVGARRPAPVFSEPADGVLTNGGPLRYALRDVPAGSTVVVEFAMGHIRDGRPVADGPVLARSTGPSGELAVPAWPVPADQIGVLTARCTRAASGPVPAVTGEVSQVIAPAYRAAASGEESFGVRFPWHPGADAGRRVTAIDGWDWVKFDRIDLAGVTGIQARVSSSGPGGVIEVQSHVTGGPLVARIEVPDTGGLDRYVTVDAPVADAPTGTDPLYLVFRTPGPGWITLDTIRFLGV